MDVATTIDWRSAAIAAAAVVTIALVLARASAKARSVAKARAAAGLTSTGSLLSASGVRRTVVADPATLPFLLELGKAMLDSGSPVTHVTSVLERVAARNGLVGTVVVVLPNAVFLSVPPAPTRPLDHAQTSIVNAGRGLNLHQIDAVFEIVRRADDGELSPAAGLLELKSAREAAHPYTRGLQLFGYALLAAGLVFILRGGVAEMVLGVALGVGVGLFQQRVGRVPTSYQVFVPVMTAFMASTAVFLVANAGVDLNIYIPVIASIVTLLPGALLTTAVIELATGQMMSGAGRLAAGGMQLVLLAIGIIAAGTLIGIPTSEFTDTDAPVNTLSVWTPWLGVAVFGIGVVLARGSRRQTWGWVLLILYTAFAAQTLSGLFVGPELAALFGAMAMTVVAMVVARQETGPALLAALLPAFWLLVPGAAGLAGVTKYLGDARVDGVGALLTAGTTMVGIAFGVLLGLAIGVAAGLDRASGLDLGPDAKSQ